MLLYIIFLAIIQGITEFLPISSSGHLVLFNKIFAIKGDFLLLSIVLHVATLFSVLIVLRKEITYIVKNPFGDTGKKLIFATIPTVIFVLLFKGIIDDSFNGNYLPICFLITAFLIVVAELVKNKKVKNKELNKKTALIMGIFQGMAVFPGISRSGSTICAGLLCGANRTETTRFSFLMSIPIIVASLLLGVFEYAISGQALVLIWYELLVGFVVAFLTGIVSVKFMLRLVEKHSLIWFSIYLIIISVVSFFV